jgi:nascent polypeptide-associated complex subunit beta
VLTRSPPGCLFDVDDKKLSGVLKKMALQPINGVEEVNIFVNTGEVIHIKQPKSKYFFTHIISLWVFYLYFAFAVAVQGSVPSNTFVISGTAESKQLTDLLPGILNQLGPESMDRLRKYAESLGVSGMGAAEEEEDDEVPELVENFEEAAAK